MLGAYILLIETVMHLIESRLITLMVLWEVSFVEKKGYNIALVDMSFC